MDERKPKKPRSKSRQTHENKGNRNSSSQAKTNKPVKTNRPAKSNKPAKPKTQRLPKEKLKVIPLGGLNEIGKNMTALEYGNEILVIDCGLSFPDDEMFGIDKVIPDFTYLEESQKKIVGLIITHGHEDHIGAVPYLIEKLDVPIYGMRFPLGLIQYKLDEHKLKARMNVIEEGKTLRLGKNFKVEPLRITHSIPDAISLCITTPVGKIFHTGDFKIDFTPYDGKKIDFVRLAQIGSEDVLLMMADSTNVLRPGYTPSEMVVGKTLDEIFLKAEKRIIIATFSSNVHRIQKIIDIAKECNRRVAFSGKSMEKVYEIGTELGYIKAPKKMVVPLSNAKNIPDKELVIITTGSQGEPMSALARMASATHKNISIKSGDIVVLSSSTVPGNELTIANVVNKLTESGAEVIYSDIAETHVSGHACQEELKLMHSLIKPKYFMPVHGEYRHLQTHKELAESLGMPEKNIFILANGDALELSSKSAVKIEELTEAEDIMVDGFGVGDVGDVVLRDRRILSESGLIIVAATVDRKSKLIASGPEIISRGFIYVKENEDMIADARVEARELIEIALLKGSTDWNSLKSHVRNGLGKYIYNKTGRKPIILPVFLEV